MIGAKLFELQKLYCLQEKSYGMEVEKATIRRDIRRFFRKNPEKEINFPFIQKKEVQNFIKTLTTPAQPAGE